MWIRYNNPTQQNDINLINADSMHRIERTGKDVCCMPVFHLSEGGPHWITCETKDEAEYVLQAIYAGIENGRKTLDIDNVKERYRKQK